MNELIDNAAWLAGYAAYGRGEGCPWGDHSARLGWIAARDEPEPVDPADDGGVAEADWSDWADRNF